MSDKICKRCINAGSEMAECTGYHNHYCDYQEIDFNPDGSVNVVTCNKYLPTGATPTEELKAMTYRDWNRRVDDAET